MMTKVMTKKLKDNALTTNESRTRETLNLAHPNVIKDFVNSGAVGENTSLTGQVISPVRIHIFRIICGLCLTNFSSWQWRMAHSSQKFVKSSFLFCCLNMSAMAVGELAYLQPLTTIRPASQNT